MGQFKLNDQADPEGRPDTEEVTRPASRATHVPHATTTSDRSDDDHLVPDDHESCQHVAEPGET
jgi:hypothetical protein